MTDTKRILNAVEQGDAKAVNVLLRLVYEELCILAAQKLSHERPGQTLQFTALVHETYVGLVRSEDQERKGRRHFFAAASETMRWILIENVRRKIYNNLDELQADLDTWIKQYNEERVHSGKYCFGKTPMETFLDSIPLIKEKMLNNNSQAAVA